MHSTDERKVDLTPDLSALFGEIRSLMRLQLVALKELVKAAVQQEGTFQSFAGNGAEMPVQKGVNGTVRWLHNPSLQVINVQLVDGMETYLYGTQANPIVMPAGAGLMVYIPFKNGLRAIVTAGGAINGFLAIAGDLKD